MRCAFVDVSDLTGGLEQTEDRLESCDFLESFLCRRSEADSSRAVDGHLESSGHGLGGDSDDFTHWLEDTKKAPQLPAEPLNFN